MTARSRPSRKYETDFAQRVRETIQRAEQLLPGQDGLVTAGDGAEDAILDPCIDAVFEDLRDELRSQRSSRAAKLSLLTLDLQRLREEALTLRVERRLSALRGVQEALGALHGISDPGQLFDTATAVLCKHCGFDRAILFAVEGDELVAQSVHFSQDPAWAAEIREFARGAGRPRLSDLILETDMLRLRVPAIVPDAQSEPRAPRALAEATKTTSYVAAPMLPAGRVIGFLHADHYHAGAAVDEIDRDTLWAFAEGCGYAVERTLLRVHLDEQRERLAELTSAMGTIGTEICDAELALERTDRAALDATSRAVHLALPTHGAALTLTPREHEVLALLAEGETNAGIARRLYISPSTAKSHVTRVLRKMHAGNRAEAVARFMRMTDA
jgi:DNA-binding CsgD family transcriptional regulator